MEKIYGVTLDSFTSGGVVAAALKNLPRRVTARLCFDPGVEPDEYAANVSRIKNVASILAQPVDSSWASRISAGDYLSRFELYYEKLHPFIESWEVGNEANGEWLPDDMVYRIKQTNAFLKGRNCKTKLGLYGSDNLWQWLDSAGFEENAFDIVGISYYEQDNQWDEYDWESNLRRLVSYFPAAQVVISECGVSSKRLKKAYLEKYYGGLMNLKCPNYVGGIFWWYGRQDFVPKGEKMWGELANLIK